ncbi:MAG: hypothetical protein U0610_29450 [bacterium]
MRAPSAYPRGSGSPDVRDHLATEKLRERMGTDVFAFHGYVELWLGRRWVSAHLQSLAVREVPVKPLDFDGEHDALFHPFDRDGQQHMEYLRYRGEHADFPIDEMLSVWREIYPYMFGESVSATHAAARMAGGDFESEAAAESGVETDAAARAESPRGSAN